MANNVRILWQFVFNSYSPDTLRIHYVCEQRRLWSDWMDTCANEDLLLVVKPISLFVCVILSEHSAYSTGSSVGSDLGCQSRVCEYDKGDSYSNNSLIVYREKQPVAWKVCFVDYWCWIARKHMSGWNRLSWYDWNIVENCVKTQIEHIFWK